jgi:O-antigen/teichoic acid export membrane protein
MRKVWTSGALWAIDRAAIVATSAVVQIILARQLGPEGFGVLSYLLALVTLLLPLARLGLSGLLVKAILENPEQEPRILNSAFAWRLMGVLVSLGVALAIFPAGIAALLALSLLGVALQLGEHSAQARSAPIEVVPPRIALTLITALLKAYVALKTSNATMVAWVFAFEYLAQGILQWLAVRRYRAHSVKPIADSEWSRHFATRAPWLLISSFAEIIYLRIDIVMLEHFRGPAEAGVYATAARLSEVWYAAPQLVMVALFPALWQLRENSTRWREGIQATADALFWAAFAVAVIMQFIAEPLVTTLFGAEYQAAGSILALHIWAGVFVFMRALVSRWLIAEDLIRLSLWSHGAGALANVLLNLWLIPAYGAQGAAWATIVSYGIAGWLAFYLPAQTRGLAGQMASAILLPLNWNRLTEYRRRGWWAVLGSNQ